MEHNSLVTDFYSTDGYTSSRPSLDDGPGMSHSRPLSGGAAARNLESFGIWVAEPGSYESPGASDEIFIVLEGDADLLARNEEYHLRPGSIATLPAGTKSRIEVRSTLKKLYLSPRGSQEPTKTLAP